MNKSPRKPKSPSKEAKAEESVPRGPCLIASLPFEVLVNIAEAVHALDLEAFDIWRAGVAMIGDSAESLVEEAIAFEEKLHPQALGPSTLPKRVADLVPFLDPGGESDLRKAFGLEPTAPRLRLVCKAFEAAAAPIILRVGVGPPTTWAVADRPTQKLRLLDRRLDKLTFAPEERFALVRDLYIDCKAARNADGSVYRPLVQSLLARVPIPLLTAVHIDLPPDFSESRRTRGLTGVRLAQDLYREILADLPQATRLQALDLPWNHSSALAIVVASSPNLRSLCLRGFGGDYGDDGAEDQLKTAIVSRTKLTELAFGDGRLLAMGGRDPDAFRVLPVRRLVLGAARFFEVQVPFVRAFGDSLTELKLDLELAGYVEIGPERFWTPTAASLEPLLLGIPNVVRLWLAAANDEPGLVVTLLTHPSLPRLQRLWLHQRFSVDLRPASWWDVGAWLPTLAARGLKGLELGRGRIVRPAVRLAIRKACAELGVECVILDANAPFALGAS